MRNILIMKLCRIKMLHAIVFTILFLNACDPGVEYNKIIENSSDHDLMIYIYPDTIKRFSFLYKEDSIKIFRHTEISIAEYNHIGSTSEFEDCDTYADSLKSRVIDNSLLKVRINIGDKSNWTYKKIKKSFKGGGICECRLVINNDMIK